MKKQHIVLIAIGAAVAVVLLVTTITIVVLTAGGSSKKSDDSKGSNNTTELDPPNPRVHPPPSKSELGRYDRAAISCDAPQCAQIGAAILKKGENVADAAIATLLCMGVMHSQSSGTGGGFLMTIYNATTKKSKVLNARETAPAMASQNMYGGNASLSRKGGLAVAVPGEMKGFWALYKNHGGGVPWKELIEPTIKICEEGFTVDEHMANALKDESAQLLSSPTMAEILVNPATNQVWKLGDKIKRPKLAETLKIIANSAIGGDELYDRSKELTQWFVEDLRKLGGIITLEDMENYRVDWPEPISVDIRGGFRLHTVPPPGSGTLVAFILRLLSKFELNAKSLEKDADAVRTYHLIAEAFKHAYAKRTIFGDPFDPNVTQEVNDLVMKLTQNDEYLKAVQALIKEDGTNNTYEYYGAKFYKPENSNSPRDDDEDQKTQQGKMMGGTAHMSVVGPNGDAIACTTTVNLYFGAGIRSTRTGIIYNDEMDDFSVPNVINYFGVPPSPNNFIYPGKRPLSSMCPSIFTDAEGRARLAVGTAGGTKITTATTYVSLRNLWFDETIKEAIDSRRIHHQLYPMQLTYELGFLGQYVEGLEKIGHKTARLTKAGSATCGVSRLANGTLYANAEFRKGGSIAGF